MGSITRKPSGSTEICIYHNRQRHKFNLGKSTKRDAEQFLRRLETLQAAVLGGLTPDPEISAWLGRLEEKHLQRFEKIGLLQGIGITKAKSFQPVTLSDFVEDYINLRKDVKPATIIVWRRCQNHLLNHFGKSVLLSEITTGHAKEFRQFIVNLGLATATIGKMIGVSRQIFQHAVDLDLLAKNPFYSKNLSTSVCGNKSRQVYIPVQDIQKTIEAAPDADWRLIIALSRFAGLRCPSETLSLRWSNVDWTANRITVHSPKTEHHAGHEKREIPLFPEIRPYLEDCFDPNNEFVINRYRNASQNLRTTFEKIIKRAGLIPWAKLFHNLRASCQTDLTNRFPAHVVCAWLGNSEVVAKEHYLQVTLDHFEQAISQGLNRGLKLSETVGNGKKPFAHDLASSQQKTPETIAKSLENRGVEKNKNGRNRTRNLADGIGEFDAFGTSGAKSWANSAEVDIIHSLFTQDEVRLAGLPDRLKQRWESLPVDAKLLIMDILDDHAGEDSHV